MERTDNKETIPNNLVRREVAFHSLTIKINIMLPFIKYTVLWYDEKYEAKWKVMEKEGIPMLAINGDYKLIITYQKHLNPLVSLTLSSWFDVTRQLNVWNPIRKLRWVENDIQFELYSFVT